MRGRPAAIGLAVALLVSLLAGPAAAVPNRIAVLQTLDKVTARVNTVKVPVGSSFRLGTLVVTVDHCDKRPPEEPPESAAFVTIDEERPDEGTKTRVFSGWMFASSPALHALEHPVYDVWLKDCEEPIKDAANPNEAPPVPNNN